MYKLSVHGESVTSHILIGERLAALDTLIPTERAVIVTDTRVRELYGPVFPPCPVIEIGRGEGIKTLDTVRRIYTELLMHEADRSTFIVGIGGGIVCDVAGYAATTFMRGTRFGFVPTTLLAQVDAGVGGKNGVNFRGYKNMIGTFSQPEFVLCDPNLLTTLPQREVACGLAEIVKHGAIGNAALFNDLEIDRAATLALDRTVITKMICDAVKVKVAVVDRDEKEHGERRKLNFGHTFGHAVEKTTPLSHGEAVSLGMVVASRLSVEKGLLTSGDAERLKSLLESMRLPVKLILDRQAVFDALKKDKKRHGAVIHFVLLDGIGRAVVKPIGLQELERVAARLI